MIILFLHFAIDNKKRTTSRQGSNSASVYTNLIAGQRIVNNFETTFSTGSSNYWL